MPDDKILVLVSRPFYQGLGLGLKTWWSWSRDLVTKVLVLRLFQRSLKQVCMKHQI